MLAIRCTAALLAGNRPQTRGVVQVRHDRKPLRAEIVYDLEDRIVRAGFQRNQARAVILAASSAEHFRNELQDFRQLIKAIYGLESALSEQMEPKVAKVFTEAIMCVLGPWKECPDYEKTWTTELALYDAMSLSDAKMITEKLCALAELHRNEWQ